MTTTTERIHRATSADGTEIVGRVLGDGPPLVLVHGAIGDGEFAWDATLPHLTDQFTCYLPSTRGRGGSADSPDHTPPRFDEDVSAFVESVGEPVHLVGWSGSGGPVLGAAARSQAVAAVAAFEPVVIVPPVMAAAQADLGRLGTGIQRVGQLASEGDLSAAVTAFFAMICNEDEFAAIQAESAVMQSWAQAVPAMLRFLQADAAYDGPRVTDPDVLSEIDVPTLLLQGRPTALGTLFTEANRYLSDHVQPAEVRLVDGVGHFAPVLAPDVIAAELTSFFGPGD
jgi:pimeloyl-ACP methyl ester carboxylesterase